MSTSLSGGAIWLILMAIVIVCAVACLITNKATGGNDPWDLHRSASEVSDTRRLSGYEEVALAKKQAKQAARRQESPVKW